VRDYDAQLRSPSSGAVMTIRGDRPGIQFYGGQHLRGTHPHLRGICLEPEAYPNAINEPSFPSCILEPGASYRSTLVYRFGEQN
jgi:aldose 1-epimerase